ncbi:hypothetical protein BCR42DRAFT_444569 [Absidia repens]|uniref:Uncharacterized protein n=1 Tax=Absidia repens TaxID=90262 RepID=A0A1X2HLZ2_9FUNG|nr:hypothetical protein BCR42DRAFT_444569 [Absidia repens]
MFVTATQQESGDYSTLTRNLVSTSDGFPTLCTEYVLSTKPSLYWFWIRQWNLANWRTSHLELDILLIRRRLALQRTLQDRWSSALELARSQPAVRNDDYVCFSLEMWGLLIEEDIYVEITRDLELLTRKNGILLNELFDDDHVRDSFEKPNPSMA